MEIPRAPNSGTPILTLLPQQSLVSYQNGMGPAYRFQGGSHVLEGGAWNQTPLAMFPESSNPTLILRILLGCKATQRFLEFSSRSLGRWTHFDHHICSNGLVETTDKQRSNSPGRVGELSTNQSSIAPELWLCWGSWDSEGGDHLAFFFARSLGWPCKRWEKEPTKSTTLCQFFGVSPAKKTVWSFLILCYSERVTYSLHSFAFFPPERFCSRNFFLDNAPKKKNIYCTPSILTPQKWLRWGPGPLAIQVQTLPISGSNDP